MFKMKSDCHYYIQKHKGGGVICEVELIETKSIFEADMKLLDNIPNYHTTARTEIAADIYWAGEQTEEPIIEVLFHGKCKMRAIK